MSALAGKTAVVTGSSRGVGAATAKLLAAEGANVVINYRQKAPRANTVVAEIEAAGGEALAVSMDVSDEASVIAGYDAAEARFGLVDTVIANAGVNADGPATDLTIEDYDQIQAVNNRGVFLTAREGGRRLLASGRSDRGRVVILASMGGLHALTGLVAYCASKAAAVMLGRSLANEWSRARISVNVVCPGYMLTDINEEWFTSEAGRKMISKLPRKRLMPIDALSPMIGFLTSDAAAYTTGAVIKIDDAQHVD
jgi:NAD(P)-dependent dehydrogenase (short-subunit alcohol dehydrogenase family)